MSDLLSCVRRLSLPTRIADELDEIAAVWGDKAQAVEPLEIGLERDDVVVKEVSLVWIPR
jgi:hypothetical protein